MTMSLMKHLLWKWKENEDRKSTQELSGLLELQTCFNTLQVPPQYSHSVCDANKHVLHPLGAWLHHVDHLSKKPVPARGYISFMNWQRYYRFIHMCIQDSDPLEVSTIYLFSISSSILHWVTHSSCEACQRRHLLPSSAGEEKKSRLSTFSHRTHLDIVPPVVSSFIVSFTVWTTPSRRPTVLPAFANLVPKSIILLLAKVSHSSCSYFFFALCIVERRLGQFTVQGPDAFSFLI